MDKIYGKSLPSPVVSKSFMDYLLVNPKIESKTINIFGVDQDIQFIGIEYNDVLENLINTKAPEEFKESIKEICKNLYFFTLDIYCLAKPVRDKQTKTITSWNILFKSGVASQKKNINNFKMATESSYHTDKTIKKLLNTKDKDIITLHKTICYKVDFEDKKVPMIDVYYKLMIMEFVSHYTSIAYAIENGTYICNVGDGWMRKLLWNNLLFLFNQGTRNEAIGFEKKGDGRKASSLNNFIQINDVTQFTDKYEFIAMKYDKMDVKDFLEKMINNSVIALDYYVKNLDIKPFKSILLYESDIVTIHDVIDCGYSLPVNKLVNYTEHNFAGKIKEPTTQDKEILNNEIINPDEFYIFDNKEAYYQIKGYNDSKKVVQNIDKYFN